MALIQLETSLDPLIRKTFWAALFSALLGFAAYFAVRLFPLRVLDRTIGELQQRNVRFDAALTNMPHGLCMFDADRRLVVCNRRYAEIYALPPDLTLSGTFLQAILDFRRSIGNAPLDALATEAAAGAATQMFRAELEDGRIVGISHNPTPDGSYVASHEDLTAQIRAEVEIARMARYDALTDLPNRVLLPEHLDEALAVARRKSDPFAVLCLDLDRFKTVNDTLGHPAGDSLLRQVAERLRACVGETDTIARMGGDEFAILQKSPDQPAGAAHPSRDQFALRCRRSASHRGRQHRSCGGS